MGEGQLEGLWAIRDPLPLAGRGRRTPPGTVLALAQLALRASEPGMGRPTWPSAIAQVEMGPPHSGCAAAKPALRRPKPTVASPQESFGRHTRKGGRSKPEVEPARRRLWRSETRFGPALGGVGNPGAEIAPALGCSGRRRAGKWVAPGWS